MTRPIVFLLTLILLTSCVTKKVGRELLSIEEAKKLSDDQKYMKLHARNGHVFIFKQWQFDDELKIVKGNAKHLGVNRQVLQNSQTFGNYYEISYDDVVIVETNYLGGKNPGVALLGVATAVTSALAVYCIINPKACFGSCPTYYITKGDSTYLRAEGFSSSISKRLERRDLDKLHDAEIGTGSFKLLVKNEALETHMIRQLKLQVAEAREGKVYTTADNRFFSLDGIRTPLTAIAPEGNILDRINQLDSLERFSLADESHLLEKEDVYLEFDSRGLENPGLIIDSRQSLMTTFLFYQTLAYSGHAASYMYTKMETSGDRVFNKINKLYELLGGIEAYVLKDNKWEKAGVVDEQGPIASDSHLLLLPKHGEDLMKVKLVMTKGLWRINQVQLGNVMGEIKPVEVTPVLVTRGGLPDELALEQLNDDSTYLVTYPGDEYEVTYDLSTFSQSSSLFIDSRGYYIEWMREEWLAEQDLSKIRRMFLFPRQALSRLTPAYKSMEPEMEEIFWNSRYVKME